MADILESRKITKFMQTLYGNKSNIFTFCIATSDNPMGHKLSDKENAERRKQLEAELKRHRLGYYPVNGKYGNLEHSYLIGNINLALCKYFFGKERFNQESFIFGVIDAKTKTTTFEYWQQNGDGNFVKQDQETKVLRQDKADDYYSEYKGFKFSIPFSIFEEALTEISETLEENYGWNPSYIMYIKDTALNENCTLKYCWETNCSHLLTKEQELKRLNNLKDNLQEQIMKLVEL